VINSFKRNTHKSKRMYALGSRSKFSLRHKREKKEFSLLQQKEREGETLSVEECRRQRILTSQVNAFKKHRGGTGGGPCQPEPQFTPEEEALIVTTKLSMIVLPAWYGSDRIEGDAILESRWHRIEM